MLHYAYRKFILCSHFNKPQHALRQATLWTLMHIRPSVCLSVSYGHPTLRKSNKKFELMFMRRARACSSSCLQVILVCFYPFRRNSFFCSQKLHKILKPFILMLKVIQSHWCWYH